MEPREVAESLMGRDAKLLSMIAGVTLLVALGLIVYLQFGAAPVEMTPDVANQVASSRCQQPGCRR